MARNVEIKVRLKNPASTISTAHSLSDSAPVVLHQTDTFFACEQGRLKLRDFGDGTGELIFYRRPNQAGPKVSQYAITPTPDPASLLSVLGAAYSTLGTVIKTRTLLMCGRTRIHLDEVTDLGSFLELEVVLQDGESIATGEQEARRLLAKLHLDPDDLIQGAYLDLLLARKQQ